MEPLKMMQHRRTEVSLSHTGGTMYEHARSESAELVEGYDAHINESLVDLVFLTYIAP